MRRLFFYHDGSYIKFTSKLQGTRVTRVERNTRLNQVDRIPRQFSLHFVEFATSDLTISYILYTRQKKEQHPR